MEEPKCPSCGAAPPTGRSYCDRSLQAGRVPAAAGKRGRRRAALAAERESNVHATVITAPVTLIPCFRRFDMGIDNRYIDGQRLSGGVCVGSGRVNFNRGDGHEAFSFGVVQEVLLALLASEPSHGYQLRARLQLALGPLAESLNAGHVYVTLGRLEKSGLLRSERVEQSERPDRRAYVLTELGQARVAEWLADTSWPKPGTRPTFI